jgi:hypothetical protein
MAKIASIEAILTANIAKFSTNIAKAGRIFSKFVTRMKSAVTSIAGLGAKIGAIFGGISLIGIVYLFKQTMDNIDAMGKFADASGFAVETLAGLGLQARLTGSNFDTVKKTILRFERSLGDASVGEIESVRNFRRLGLSIDDLIAMRPEEAFYRVVDAIRAMPSPIDRATAALRIVGRGAGELLPLIEAGSVAMRAEVEEAKKLGTALSRVDARMVEEANDAITRLREAFAGLLTQIMVKIAPFITAFADALREKIAGMEGIPAKIEKVFTALKDAAVNGAKAFDDLVGDATRFVLALDKIERSILKMSAAWLEVQIGWADRKGPGFLTGGKTKAQLIDEYNEIRARIADLDSEIRSFEKSLASGKGALGQPLNIASRALAWLGDIYNKAVDAAKNIQAAMDNKPRLGVYMAAVEAQNRYLDELERFARGIRQKTVTPLERFEHQLTMLNDALREGMLTWNEYGRGVRLAHKDFQKALKDRRGETKIAGAMVRGSAEAASAMAKWQSNVQANEVERRQEQHLRALVRINERMDNHLRMIAEDEGADLE